MKTLSKIINATRFPSNLRIEAADGIHDISVETGADYAGETWTDDEAIEDARGILRDHGLDDATADHWLLSAIAEQFPRKKTKTYEIWLVPNGRRLDFRRGMTGRGYPDACKNWGMDLTLDDVRQRYRELAEENFRRSEGPWDEIFFKANPYEDGLSEDEEERRRQAGEDAADAALDKYLNELTADPDPLNWGGIEWHDDLKFVTIRESEPEE